MPSPPARTGKLAPLDASQKSEPAADDVLNAIIPPREFTDGGQLWVQQVSSTPATRRDVLNLQDSLDTKLQQRQARETGIDPVRRELYSQTFGERLPRLLPHSTHSYSCSQMS